ncbi:hypothetical protein JHK85_016091 [Glycine max]|nr:hypothetical protein JHK85_016091 [Glycine max]
MGHAVLILVVVISSIVLCPSSLALTQDGLTLLEVKSTLNDTRNFLSNWRKSGETHCTWTGITCHPGEQRVRSINLPYMQLGGIISPSIGKLSRLHRLNLSTNFFSGEIPDIGVLSTFGNNAFIGNLDLCGRQVQKPCRTSLGFPVVLPHAEIPDKRSSHYVKWVLVGAITIMGLALVMTLSLLWICLLSKKERAARRYIEVKDQINPESSRKNDGTKLITFHGDLPYTSLEIIEKLESLDEDDVVGSGGFGTVYRMVMNDCGTFAVKRIDRSREGSDQGFERELEILGSIKHINLVNLRGYCRLPSTKLLIYDYLAMGSLDDLLHENTEQSLNWSTRLKIALGSARGLTYLHHDCCPKIVHRDIKSSNILLDENMEPRVSDFGLAKLLVDEDAHVTTVVAGTFGYLAPGMYLVPHHLDSGNPFRAMNTFLKENRLEDVVDKRCIDADLESVEVILELAASCTDANADERPSMNQVLQILEQEEDGLIKV